MKRRFLLCALVFVRFLAACSADATGEITKELWIAAAEESLDLTREELRTRLGSPASAVFDEILSVEIDKYSIAENESGFFLGEVIYANGRAAAFVSRVSKGRVVLDKFMEDYGDEIIDCGDLYLIARSQRLDAYLVVETRDLNAVFYLLRVPFYQTMSDTGDLPPLPSPSDRHSHGP